MLIICLDYVLQTSIDLIKNGLTTGSLGNILNVLEAQMKESQKGVYSPCTKRILWTHNNMFIYIYIYIYGYLCVYLCVCVCVCVYIYIYIYTHTHRCVHFCVCVCVCVCVHIYIHIKREKKIDLWKRNKRRIKK